MLPGLHVNLYVTALTIDCMFLAVISRLCILFGSNTYPVNNILIVAHYQFHCCVHYFQKNM